MISVDRPTARSATVYRLTNRLVAAPAGVSRSYEDRDRRLAALVKRMADQEESALAELFSLTVNRLYAFALVIVRDPGLAEEVTEDAMFQAWRHAARFDANRGKAITWLLTICRSRALDALRRIDIAACVDDPHALRLHNACEAHEPEQLLAKFQTGSAVHAALLQLPATERHVISLAFFRGLTHREIADHWQIPLGTVKTLMHRAFSKLRTLLEGERSSP